MFLIQKEAAEVLGTHNEGKELVMKEQIFLGATKENCGGPSVLKKGGPTMRIPLRLNGINRIKKEDVI